MRTIKIIYIEADVLCLLENNPRQTSKDAVKQLAALINEHGFQNPLQVYFDGPATWTILCGNHRYAAGLSLGMTSFPCIEYHGDRTKAIGRAISDNRSNEWTKWDIPLLKDLLADVDDGDIDVGDLTGFEIDHLDKLFDYEPKVKKVKCPECKHEFEI